MGYTRSTEALILKTHDIGEADRLCILLTKDFGRIAARARAVRKLTSRHGGSLLPLQYVTVELAESGSSYTVARAVCIDSHDACRKDFARFLAAEQMVNLLLKHLEDATPVPTLFHLASDFLTLQKTYPPAFLFSAFALAFFHEIGTLPSLRHSIITHVPLSSQDPLVVSRRFEGICLQEEDPAGRALSAGARELLWNIEESSLRCLPSLDPSLLQEFTSIVASLVGTTLPVPMRAGSSSAVTPTW